jgi:branched-chain amino acid transport system permease protein
MFAGVALNPVLAEHQGIYLMKYRVIAFTVAAVFTGYAGALYTHFLSIITPLVFGLLQSLQIMIFAIVGGISSFVGGPVLGTFLLYNLASYTARLETYGLSPFIFSAVVVIIVVFLPRGSGLIDLWHMFWKRIWS